jgi:hypothetical protein
MSIIVIVLHDDLAVNMAQDTARSSPVHIGFFHRTGKCATTLVPSLKLPEVMQILRTTLVDGSTLVVRIQNKIS